jgi:chorismate synthase
MNQLGRIFSVTSFGESHGTAVGCVIDGCPAGLKLDLNFIQQQVDRRKTGKQSFASQRRESDLINIISGVYEGRTLGSPITLMINNNDARSEDYDHLKNIYRPGHADYTYQSKYGFRDHRGGGRSSIRITAPMVGAGAIALQLLQTVAPIKINVFVTQIGKVKTDIKSCDFEAIESSPVRCPDEKATAAMLDEIANCAESGDTLGGKIRCCIEGVPVGWGEPIFGKIQALLGHAMFSINTVKGVSFGEGFDAAEQTGSVHNDRFVYEAGTFNTEQNKAGGVLGGITTGETIVMEIAFKPISGIQQKQAAIDRFGKEVPLAIGGRHDVCAVPRAVPIVEAYTAIVLADLMLHSKQQFL